MVPMTEQIKRLVRLLPLAAIAIAIAPSVQNRAQTPPSPGPAPICPYGYYDVAPYTCAPYGYYSPEWFPGGIFIGAGPWFHGPANFAGKVDNRFDPIHGYKGPFPDRGERPFNHFHGNETRDGRGHTK
jgi:hypothetical protein